VKIGIALLCRLNSRRLPGKILRRVNGQTLLEHIVSRIKLGAPECPVVVTTSQEDGDAAICELCRKLALNCFRGSLDDVAGRMLACAQLYQWDFVVRINGDNLFVDPPTLRAMLQVANANSYDFITNVPGRTFPFGMSVEILRTSTFAEILRHVDRPDHREHVTSWFYENPDVCKTLVFTNQSCPEASGLQLAIDTVEDLERARYILRGLGHRPEAGAMREVVKLAYEWNARQAQA
jgi:spore coat polysaccharide biosynthesis protein SpsF (cytidylyltransferase family)